MNSNEGAHRAFDLTIVFEPVAVHFEFTIEAICC